MTFWIEAIGWLGAALTLTAYSAKTMLPLRSAAVFANAAFIAYGALVPVWPQFALHCALLPLNGWRLYQMARLTRRAREAQTTPDAFAWIAELQKPAAYPEGTRLFARGDAADVLYYVVSGRVRFPEIDREIGPRTLFGEIAFFSEERRRTASAICASDCTLVVLDEARFMAAFHQDPAFGLAIVRLLARRLIEGAGPAPAAPATGTPPAQALPRTIRTTGNAMPGASETSAGPSSTNPMAR